MHANLLIQIYSYYTYGSAFITGGPFYIRCICGTDTNEKYLALKPYGQKNVLLVTKKDDATPFSIEKACKPGEFYIVDYANKSLSVNADYRFLGIVTKTWDGTGEEKGPLQIGGVRAAKFILCHDQEDRKPSIADWENGACFVKLAPRKILFINMQHNSYLGIDDVRNCTIRVSSREEQQEKGNIWLSFKLECLHDEKSYATIYRAPKFGKNRAEPYPPIDDDIDDVDFDFEYEFGHDQCHAQVLIN